MIHSPIRRMKFIILALTLLLLSAFAAAGTWQDLIVYDCNGGFQSTPSLGLTNAKVFLPSLTRVYRAYYDMLFDRVSCKCPTITHEQFERLFFPSIGYTLNMLAGPNADISLPAGCSYSDFRNTSIAGFRLNATSEIPDTYIPTLGVPFALPSSCDYNAWKTTGECKLKFSMPSNIGLNLELMMKKCPNSVLPFISLSCSGFACDKSFMPCDSSADCGSGMTCTTLKTNSTSYGIRPVLNSQDITNVLNAFSVADTCRTPGQIMAPIFNLIRKYFDGSVVTHGTTEYRMCLPTAVPTAVDTTSKQLQDALVPADACLVDKTETCTNYTSWRQNYDVNGTYTGLSPYNITSCYTTIHSVDCATPQNAALRPWDGIMSTGASAGSSDRMLGSAAPATVPRPLTPRAVVLAYTDCSNTDFHLLPTSNFLPLFGNLKIAQEAMNLIWGSIHDAAKCDVPTLNDDTFRVKWGAMWDFILYYFTLPQGTPIQSIARGWTVSPSGQLNMPSTCTYEHWRTTGSCSLRFTGLSDLLGAETVIQLRSRKCPSAGAYSFPELYIECAGEGCSVLNSIKPCSSHADCVTGLVCQDLSLLWDKMGIKTDIFADLFWPNSGGGSCRSMSRLYENLRRILLTLTGNDLTGISTTSVCMHSVSHIVSVADTWVNSQTTTDAGKTTLNQLYAWDAPTDDIVLAAPRAVATLTITVSTASAPTQAQLDEIAKRIASVFGLDVSTVKVYFNPKKRATYDIVVEFYATQSVVEVAKVETSTQLQNSITSAISEATGNSIQVQSIAAAVTPLDPLPGPTAGAGLKYAASMLAAVMGALVAALF